VDVETYEGLKRRLQILEGIARGEHAVEPPHSSFQVPNEWWDRLKPISDDLKEMLLEADFCFSVTVGNLSESGDVAGYVKTGLKWPRKY
jgi:hypothetical protein